MSDSQPNLYMALTGAYRAFVSQRHADLLGTWPIISGANLDFGVYHGWSVFFFRHTGNTTYRSSNERGELPRVAIGFDVINANNLEVVRESLYRYFRAQADDGLFVIPPDGQLYTQELNKLFARHQHAMGLVPMRLFLSHKSPDKTMVRNFERTLKLLGFDPWLDEDAMAAGAQLDRAILQGMKESCAAIFFLTPRFSDENYLATEINYAIAEQRKRPEQFTIITLLFSEGGVKPDVPGLLMPFVWKEPDSPLSALREIVRALPVKVGEVRWR